LSQGAEQLLIMNEQSEDEEMGQDSQPNVNELANDHDHQQDTDDD